MANPEQLQILKKGVDEWNAWRMENPNDLVDLSGAELNDVVLSYIVDRKLYTIGSISPNTNGTEISPVGPDLTCADLRDINLSGAHLGGAQFFMSNLTGAKFCSADLSGADFNEVDLTAVDFRGAALYSTSIRSATMNEAHLHGATLYNTEFSDLDLHRVLGLDSCIHKGPSILDHRTLMQSGRLPLAFLRGCGLPDRLIEYLPSLLGEAIHFYSCFISYSTMDQDFADRFHADLQNKGVRCWFAPHDIQSGKKIHEQIDEAIRLYDKLLLILSPASINSEWVKTEISKARKREIRDNRRMLFPLRLVDFETLRDWECFDADTGKDSAREIREYFIPDFSRWKTDHDTYAQAFDRLLKDLRTENVDPRP